ncbi:MAG: UDP-N-acetylmuramoyl-L-alanyl-D-glutamate--2,6-diaminopimelate ligase [Coriobacteriia bacterium]|nr:UDP-N-acetylmuramoyl-L-alanyl-D-glutamate--2,6-diaminopimelate ligase [Coriobacteriia bacterium]
MDTLTLSQLADELRSAGIEPELVAGAGATSADPALTGAACDSRAVRPGDLFVCKGAAFRPAFLASAAEACAVAYLCDAEKLPELAAAVPALPAIAVPAGQLRRAMALASAAAFGRPDRDLPIVGITGTKGKTTCAYMLRSIVDHARGAGSCGIIGTVETYDGVEDGPSRNTTPESPDLWRHLANARDAHLGGLVMEVSSQALKYDRSYGVELALGCFLNIGLDHISPVEHADFDDYFGSKLRIFEQCRRAVVNLDSDHADRILAAAQAGPAERVITFGIERPDAYAWASGLRAGETGISFTLHLGDETRPASLPFPGDFSVSNALCAAICAEELGLSIEQIVAGLAVTRVPGRMEFYRSADERLTAVVDYAHNRLAFDSLLSAIQKSFNDAEVIAVFGAVGGKAVERRRDLPEVAARYADRIVLTTDDPWTEDPADICRQMEEALPAGFPHETVLDREAAVARAFELAETCGRRAVVLLLAKGSDDTQHMADGYVHVETDSELAKRAVATYDAAHPTGEPDERTAMNDEDARNAAAELDDDELLAVDGGTRIRTSSTKRRIHAKCGGVIRPVAFFASWKCQKCGEQHDKLTEFRYTTRS